MNFLKEVESAKKKNNEFISNISKSIISYIDDMNYLSSIMLYAKLLSWENYVEYKIYYITFVKKFKELMNYRETNDSDQIEASHNLVVNNRINSEKESKKSINYNELIDCDPVLVLYNFFEIFLEVNKIFYDLLESSHKSEITKDFIVNLKDRFIFRGFIDFIFENQKLTREIYYFYKELNNTKKIKFDFERIRENIINSLNLYILNNKNSSFEFSNNFYKTYSIINGYFYDKYLLDLLHYDKCNIIDLVNREFSNVTVVRMFKTIVNTMLSCMIFRIFVTIIEKNNDDQNIKLILNNIVNINKYMLSHNIKNEMVDVKPLIEALHRTLQIIQKSNILNNISLFIE